MRLKKILIASATILLSAFALVGCGSSSSDSKKTADKSDSTIRISEKDVISTMDSSLATDVISGQNLNNTMEGLYRYNGNELHPALSKEIVKPTNNGLTYTFPLRKNAKWSNGDPVTADDFVFAWKRIVDPKTKSSYAYIYEGVANAKDISAGKKPVDSLGVKAIDKYTFEVTLEKAIPYFNELMTSYFFFPLNQKVVDRWGKKYGTDSKTLVFNGPYKLVNWKGSDNSWTEEKNDKYWDANNVKVKKIQYQVVKDPNTAVNLYQNKKLDRALLTGDTAKQMNGSDGFGITKKFSTMMIAANQEKNSVFKNAKIRQALSMSINRKQLTEKVLGGSSVVSNSVTATGMSFNPDDKSKDFTKETSESANKYTKYDPTAAKKLWEEGLSETGNTGKNFSFVLLGDDTDEAKKRSEFLQNQLEKLPGLKITLNNVPFKSRLSRASNGEFDLVVFGWSPDFPDPINILTLFTTNSSYNYARWSNEKFDSLVNKSLTEDANNPSARWKDMIEAQNVINEEQGSIPLYQAGEAWMTNKNIKKMTLNPSGMYDMNLVELKD